MKYELALRIITWQLLEDSHLCSLHRSVRCSGILRLCPHTPCRALRGPWSALQGLAWVALSAVILPHLRVAPMRSPGVAPGRHRHMANSRAVVLLPPAGRRAGRQSHIAAGYRAHRAARAPGEGSSGSLTGHLWRWQRPARAPECRHR